MGNSFVAGDRVRISNDSLWAKGATGKIASPPDEVTKVSGAWDGGLTWQEKSAFGTNTVYWVWFDQPQYDPEGEGPFIGGCIWQSALAKL